MPGQPVKADGARIAQPKAADETLPNADAGQPASSIFRCFGLCSCYIVISAGLIEFNKHLMRKDRFPFAVAMTTGHMAMTCVLCNLLYWAKPSLYPSMAQTEGQRLRLLQWFLPLGCLFAVGLSCSNKAYLYCSVAFLQFMKESNVAVVFAMGSFVGLQRCTRSRLFILFWIVIGASIAVQGQVDFLWLGFGIQVISQVAECSKTVLGEMIMKGDLKLDPLTYTRFMSPIGLCVLLLATATTWEHEVVVRFQEWWHLLLPNACLAFVLNVIVAMIIKECSGLTFMLTGLVKDMIIVIASTLFFGELVVHQQILGFVVCIAGILFWSHMRASPDSPSVKGLQMALGETKADTGELAHLLFKKAHVVGP